jgi:pyruvate/2-oxoacid:ferredoxin oxidoreductase beta subunit
MIIINDIQDFEKTNLHRDMYGISLKKLFMEKSPYSYFSEGMYDYYEEFVVFVLIKNENYEYEIDKLETARIIEHKSSVDSADNYHETKKSIKEQLAKYNYEGIIILYRHSNSWNDESVNEKIYISKNDIEKIIEEEELQRQEELKHQSKKQKKVAEKINENSDDIRYLSEEDI